MRNRNAIIGLAIVVVVGGWYAFRPERLFVNKTVNESLDTSSAMAGGTTMPATAAAPMTLAMGSFHSNAHDTRGSATVIDLGGGRRVLRLTNFATSNGPDVRIYLVAAPDVQDNATVKTAGFVELGPMKGNIGDQNYDIPASVDLASYRTVTIWCKRFSVNFGSAPLAKS
jgi:Electron transfer DM13